MTEKIEGPITFGPFAHPMLSRILAHYGPRAFARSSACMGFIDFLDEIDARGKCALEIGTYHGITALLLAERFERVISVSIDDEDPGKLLKRELAEFAGVGNIEFHDVKNNAQKAALIERLEFDFAYSDGDHTHDTKTDFALVRRCGRVLFHEYWALQAPVFNLVNSLPQDEVTRCRSDILAFGAAPVDSAIALASFVEDGDLRICPRFGVAYQADFAAGRVEYGEGYFAKVCAYEGGEIAKRVNAGRCEMLARNLPAGARVLDYGAGSGAFMREARAAGFEMHGFDVIEETARWLRATGAYSDDPARFGAVTFWDVLEHLERPADPLAQLRAGALAFVSVPIFTDLLRVRESRHYRPGEHLYYWTANGLTAWMAVQGFRLIESSRHEIDAGRDSIGAFAFLHA